MNEMDMGTQLSRWLEECRACCTEGKTADYIPALAKADPNALGITIHALGQQPVSSGDCGAMFTLQSVSKVFTLLLALMDHGEEGIFARVGMEPTGDDFKSMLKLELVSGKPFNPFINAGAITVTSMIKGSSQAEKWQRIRNFIATLAGEDDLGFNEDVYVSEKETANRNRSLAYFLKDSAVLSGDVEEHLDLYFMHCAIEMNCVQLARAALVLANDGMEPESAALSNLDVQSASESIVNSELKFGSESHVRSNLLTGAGSLVHSGFQSEARSNSAANENPYSQLEWNPNSNAHSISGSQTNSNAASSLGNSSTVATFGSRQLIPRRYVQIAKTFMLTCGMYNASGEFAVKVGLPAKSGVSGAIMALVPGKMGIGVIGPALNDKSNSVGGIRLLEKLSHEWGLSMF